MRMKVIGAAAMASLVAVTPAQAQDAREAGDVLVRARAILVSPTEESSEVSGFAGSGVGLSDSLMPEVDVTWLVTRNIGLELIASTTRHDISGQGSLAALGDVAETWALPPTLTLQYHFAPGGSIHPYVGAGVNYTFFHSSKPTASPEGALGRTDVDLDDSFGFALQAGVDFEIGRKLFVNFDVKFIDMDTTAHLRTAGGTATVDVDVNPLVFGMGVGTRF